MDGDENNPIVDSPDLRADTRTMSGRLPTASPSKLKQKGDWEISSSYNIVSMEYTGQDTVLVACSLFFLIT